MLEMQKFVVGQAVKIKSRVKSYGNRIGTVAATGVQLGYPVVSVKFEALRHPIVFAPEELESYSGP